MTVRRTDYPALAGRPVTEAHARVCRESGHATHSTDGRPAVMCPRCGESASRPIADTRHADGAYARQMAAEATAAGPRSVLYGPVPSRIYAGMLASMTAAERAGYDDDAACMSFLFRPSPIDSADKAPGAPRGSYPVGALVDVLLPATADGVDVLYGLTVTGHPFTTKPRLHTVTMVSGQFLDVDVARLRPHTVGMPADVCSLTGLQNCADRDCELHYMEAPLRLAPEPTAAPESADGFAAAHDAYMARTYAEPWDQAPTTDPGSGDALTGTYGRTYAESGWVAMQAAADLFGPYSGHCPILLFQVTTPDGRPYTHGVLGGCVLTHADTYDTWAGALRAMRAYVIRTLCTCAHDVRPCYECQTAIDAARTGTTGTGTAGTGTAGTGTAGTGDYPGTCTGCTATEIYCGHRAQCPDRWEGPATGTGQAPRGSDNTGTGAGHCVTCAAAPGQQCPAWCAADWQV